MGKFVTKPQTIKGLNNVKTIAAGYNHSIIVKNDGTVLTWGNNDCGQLGLDSTDTEKEPLQVPGMDGIVGAAGGGCHTIFIDKNGDLFGCGLNDRGQIGDGTCSFISEPVQVSGLGDIKAISAGHRTSYALDSSGKVSGWGENVYLQLGDGVPDCTTEPVAIKDFDNVTQIATGDFHTIVVKNDGSVWSMGANWSGQLGNGVDSKDPKNATLFGTAQRVKDMENPISIAAGNSHSLAVKADGTVWTWGNGNEGELGDGAMDHYSPTPVQAIGLTGITSVAAGSAHSLALGSGGTIWAWGFNEFGQLGNFKNENISKPQQVIPGGASRIAAGDATTIMLKTDSSVVCWGDNSSGQLGAGTFDNSNQPEHITGYDNSKQIAGGHGFTVTVKNDGTVWASGENGYGQLGNGTNVTSNKPVQVKHLENIVAVDCGGSHAIALKADGTVWAWGDNSKGQLGQKNIDRHLPVKVSLNLNGSTRPNSQIDEFTMISIGGMHSAGLKKDGTVWCWGNGDWGQLGDGTKGDGDPSTHDNDRSKPVQVKGLTRVVYISAGEAHTMALKSDGTVWCWGDDEFGQLGDGKHGDEDPATVDCISTVPVQAKGLTGVKTVSAGQYHSTAVKNDGTVWTWGNNYVGQLGIGTSGDISVIPVQVNTLSQIVQVAAGEATLALKKDGTVYAWGNNEYGTVGNGKNGDGDSNTYDCFVQTPVQVTGLQNVKSVYTSWGDSAALCADGSFWSWGMLYGGSPKKETSINTVAGAAVGKGYIILLGKDGYAYLRNLDDSILHKMAGPDQITNVTAYARSFLAIKKDGSVWAAGENACGLLGNRSTQNIKEPVKLDYIRITPALAPASSK